MINELAKEIHENAKNKGFYEGEKNIGEMLCLIHSEVSEALEADRKGRYASTEYIDKLKNDGFTWEDSKISYDHGFSTHIKDTFEDELADIMIRIMDLAAFKGINLEKHIALKMKYNSMREYKHGKKY